MANLMKRLAGPYFDFLVGPEGGWWERCHPKRRTMVLKKECIHNPDAVRVSISVIELVADCFASSHQRFNYYGDTEYSGEHLAALIVCLSERLEAVRACKWKREFDALTSDMFRSDCEQHLARRHRHWRYICRQTVECLDEALRRAVDATTPGKALLVLGV